jgi:NAD(P)-dependent dehydrogenase (short-subunit alcohol dehydrogenase family)
MRLKGRVAIVTGAGRGIGRAIALRLAEEGADVVVTARNDSEVRSVAAEIQKAGRRAAAVAADVGTESGCEKIVAAAREGFGAIHILVNNAGILGAVKPIQEITAVEWDEVIKTNLRGPFLMSRLVLPEMYQRGSGVILNITSIAGKAAFAMSGAYAASKAALAGLTRTLASEGAANGVRVNAVSPGPVAETKMIGELTGSLAAHFHSESDQVLQQMVQGALQKRPQKVEEIAAAAAFLVSDDASAITGQTLNVDGGMAFY